MDCDFTHPPHYIVDALAAADDADVVVGSRYLKERSLAGWNVLRKFLTRTGHVLTHSLLAMPYDATGGFRLYNLARIPAHTFDLVGSNGYSFLFEVLYILHVNRFRIKEIPIALPPRTYGHSKMGVDEIGRSLGLLVEIYVTKKLNPERFVVSERLSDDEIDPAQHDVQGWDEYWQDQKKPGRILYDIIAAFYRKVIIRPSLNRFIKQTFEPGARVLHAGCGGGQVDVDIRDYVAITGLDISVNALNLYKRAHGGRARVLHGSVFMIPSPDGSFDGIYNLGVMEHFELGDIERILAEFHRVLRPGGRIVLFWPPEFGASVLFFKGLTWTFANLLGQTDVKFHPDEVSRLRSERQARELLERAGFRVLRYAFGVRDLFTYSIITAERVDRAAAGSVSQKASA